MKRILVLLLTSVWGQSFTSFMTPSVGPTKGPVADVPGGFRCMNRGSTGSPPYTWTNHDVRWVGGVLTVSLDDGNTGNPAFRDFCWNMDPANDEPVAIYYQAVGGRELAVLEDASASRAREAQAIGQWLNPFMCPVMRSGLTLPPASQAQPYVIAPGTSCWDSPPWSPVGGMYDNRQTYLMHFQPASAAQPMLTCCQQSGNSACPVQYIRCGGAWEATLSLPGASASAAPAASASAAPAVTPTGTDTPSTTPSAAAAGASATSTGTPSTTPSATGSDSGSSTVTASATPSTTITSSPTNTLPAGASPSNTGTASTTASVTGTPTGTDSGSPAPLPSSAAAAPASPSAPPAPASSASASASQTPSGQSNGSGGSLGAAMAATAASPAPDASSIAAYASIGLVVLAALAAGGALLWRHGRAQGVATARKAWEEDAAAPQRSAPQADEAARVTVVTHNPMSGAAAGPFGRARATGFTEGSR